MTPREAVEALKLINLKRVHPFYNWEEMLQVRDTAIEALKFKEYFDGLYGQGLEIANWHQNGELEPFDNFYENALDWNDKE